MNKNYIIYSLFLLTACGSSNSVGNQAVNPQSFTIADLIATGGTPELATTKASFLFSDRAANMVTAEPATDVDLSFETAADGRIQIRLSGFGHDVILSEDDLVQTDDDEFYEVDLPDGSTTFWLVLLDSTWKDFVAGRSPEKYAFTYAIADYNELSGVNNRAYGVAGLPTPPPNLIGLPTATYATYIIGDFYSSADPNEALQVLGDLSLTANFAESAITGRLDNITLNSTPALSDLNVNEGSIVDGSFSTTFSVDTESCSSCPSFYNSKLDGTFYGDSAQEIGGTFEASGIDTDGNDWVSIGSYTGQK